MQLDPVAYADDTHVAKFDRTDTDTDTDFLADFRARILARKSACRSARAAVGLQRRARGPRHERAGHARQSSPTCPLGMRACTRVRVRVLYMINYRVHVYEITR